ncbi:DNA-binding response regulator, partial [Lacticaseibacillus rhamnosus]
LLREEMGNGSGTPAKHEALKFDNLIVNLTRREVTLDDTPLPLKPKEYELLLFFAEHKGQMLSREFVLERVWGWDYIGDSRTVDVHIRWLRQKVEKDPANPVRIVTGRSGGYRRYSHFLVHSEEGPGLLKLLDDSGWIELRGTPTSVVLRLYKRVCVLIPRTLDEKFGAALPLALSTM